jgi:hypothetical protein
MGITRHQCVPGDHISGRKLFEDFSRSPKLATFGVHANQRMGHIWAELKKPVMFQDGEMDSDALLQILVSATGLE